ncbi:unnamed protein product [Menidia menidia]|uniref:Interleukin-17 receptor D n=1 Tax=Menidia menidia TaxID=238744 RepID=A0A8S4BJK7_9TELE|nr:unnamed protein product [Menidia menidia]
MLTWCNEVDCSLNYPLGKHVIHEVANISFGHLACEDQAAVVVHWSPSPLGIEHIKGFRVYLEDKNPEGKQCQHLILKDPRQLNFSFRTTKLSSQPFSGLTFDTDYMVRVVPFPSLMNESFFPPSFLRTNSCEVLLGSDNLVCKPFWKPKTLNVSQLGSNLHVSFDQAPATFGFHFYYLYYKLRQDGPFRLQRCKTDPNQVRTTCILQDVTPGTYAIELRDDRNTTRRQTQYYVSQVHSPWAGPIRAMAITVPLVIMSAFATLFTVMCRKKQQENIYSHLDEESSESSNQSAALNSERPWPRPKVFICYSSKDCPKHTSVIQSFAYFLQDFCGCEVVLDLWEHLEMCKEGQMAWLSRQLDEANHIVIVCSKGLRYYVERKSRRGKTPVSRRGSSSSPPTGVSHGDQFIAAVAMIAEKLRLAKQSENSGEQEPNRYMALMDQLPQLFSLLHSGPSGFGEHEQTPVNVSRRNYFRSKSGRSLYVSICNMHQYMCQNPDWFEKQPAPPAGASSAPPDPPLQTPPPPSSPERPAPRPPPETGRLLPAPAEVRLRPGDGQDPVTRGSRCKAQRAPTGPRLQFRLQPGAKSQSQYGTLSQSRSLSQSRLATFVLEGSPSVLRDGVSPVPAHAEEDHSSAPEAPPPRDSGIYDSSVPSSELSIPLMEGLSHDQADSCSLAESESSSSGLGDEEPPAVASLFCSAARVCKAELHPHRHLEHGNTQAASS